MDLRIINRKYACTIVSSSRKKIEILVTQIVKWRYTLKVSWWICYRSGTNEQHLFVQLPETSKKFRYSLKERTFLLSNAFFILIVRGVIKTNHIAKLKGETFL